MSDLIIRKYDLKHIKIHLNSISCRENFDWNMPVYVFRTLDHVLCGFENEEYNVGYYWGRFPKNALPGLRSANKPHAPLDILLFSFRDLYAYVFTYKEVSSAHV